MPTVLILAIISMTLALIFYSIGVWGERRAGIIKGKHIIFFSLGFLCDSTGTAVMKVIVNNHILHSHISNLKATIHSTTGALALLLMLIHFIWAIYVWKFGSLKAKENFHKFSIVVWSFWLIPYFVGVIIGMSS